jgi:hypothetical protein
MKLKLNMKKEFKMRDWVLKLKNQKNKKKEKRNDGGQVGRTMIIRKQSTEFL